MTEGREPVRLTAPSLVLTVHPDATATMHDLAGQALLPGPTPLVAGPEASGTPEVVPARRAAAGGLRLGWPSGARLDLAVEGDGLGWRWTGAAPAWFPFLAALAARPGARGWRPLVTPAPGPAGTAGPFVGRARYRRATAWPLPLVAEGAAGRCVAVLVDPAPSVAGLGVAGLLAAPGVAGPVAGAIVAHGGGWEAAFGRYRERLRAGLEPVARAAAAWLRRGVVHRFVFLYGAEVAEPGTGRPDVARLMAADDDLGGADAVLLWLAYPRLGVDARSQWELWDDLPGGREGLRAFARALQERGVRVLVPYLPWDGDPAAHPAALARLVADVGADGVFLDTMGAADPALRAALGPGVALVGENRAVGDAFAQVDGSWDQPPSRDLAAGDWSAAAEALPSVDLGRFVVPEHPLFGLNRHTSGPTREAVLRRCVFGGTGILVWQDVFGLMLPYSAAESRLLRRCARVLRAGAAAFADPAPTPFVDTLVPGVTANAFTAADGTRLWTLHNAGPDLVSAPFLPVDPAPGHRLTDLTLAPGDVGVLTEVRA